MIWPQLADDPMAKQLKALGALVKKLRELKATGAAFDAKPLSRLGDALTDWRKSSHGLALRGADDAGPHVVACDSPDARLFGICMPIRIKLAVSLPAWL